MRFIRLATYYFSPPPPGWESFRIEIDGVVAQSVRLGNAPPGAERGHSIFDEK